MPFDGFAENEKRPVRLPETFFRDLLWQIDHLGELRVTLYVFWRLERKEGSFRCLRWAEFLADAALMGSLGRTAIEAQNALEDALARAAQRGTLLVAHLPVEQVGGQNGASAPADEQLVFINNAKGRAAMQSIQKGEWRATGQEHDPLAVYVERPNIYRLYEGNIGPLTPMLAESLRDAETLYPSEWIEDAIRIAVERNKRSWRYVEAILRRWQEGGRDDRTGKKEQDRPDAEQARQRYARWEQRRSDK
ncbi:MAG TPA: DnaD domain protein [Anaerolineales bacterium]|nr:DnaD domain protein [Anaerolineales bacterium]